MALTINTLFNTGSLMTKEGILGTNTGCSIVKSEKGWVLSGGNTNTVSFATTITGVKSIAFGIKTTGDTKLFRDSTTDKLQISSGAFSGTGLTATTYYGVSAYATNKWMFVVCDFSGGISFSTNFNIYFSANTKIWDVSFSDTVLTTIEKNNLYAKFLSASPYLKPTSIELPKPTSITTTGCIAAYNMVKSGTTLVDISNNGKNGTLSGGYVSTKDGIKFNGTNGKCVLGNLGNVKSISFRLKLNSTTEKIMEGAANDKLIHVSSGTLTTADFATKYVNGVAGSTLTAGQWHDVMLVSASSVSFSACSLALNNATYGNFEIADLRFNSGSLTSTDAVVNHNSFIRPTLIEDFSNSPAENITKTTLVGGYRITSGSFRIGQDSTSKYLECVTAGSCIKSFKDIDTSTKLDVIQGSGDITPILTTNSITLTMVAGSKLRKLVFVSGNYISSDSQGLSWDQSSTNGLTYERLGSITEFARNASPGNANLPIHSQMKGCTLNDNGTVNYYLGASDWNYKADGITSSVLTGADGQVMVEIPKYYVKYWAGFGKHNYVVTLNKNKGIVHPAFVKNGVEVNYRYIGAYEGILYDNSASIYANGLYLSLKSIGFTASTKTITKLTGSVATVNMTGANAGTGYSVGNVLTLAGGTVGATVTVATIGGSGEVLTITLTTKGYGHTTGVKATTGGGGSNCTINIATLETLSNPFTALQVGDKITISGSVSNNVTFTVATVSDASITVSETVTDETYALTTTITTQKDYTATTGDKLSSISGKVPISYFTRAQGGVLASNRGAGWRQIDYDLVNAIEWLGLIEYGTFYWQNIAEIGPGITAISGWDTYNDYTPFAPSGNGNTKGNISADNAGNAAVSTEKVKYSKYRGIENFYGHVWKWVDGINVNSNVPYVTNNTSYWADNTSTNYTSLGITLAASNGYQSTLAQSSRIMLPTAAAGASSTFITDYYYQSTGWRVAYFGGSANAGTLAGGWCWSLDGGSGAAVRYIASRIAF